MILRIVFRLYMCLNIKWKEKHYVD